MPRSTFAVLLLAATSFTLNAADAAPRTITVRGRSEIVYPPDHVTVHAAVIAKADDARVAQKRAHEQAAAILAFLREAGVAPDDLATDRTDLREIQDPSDDDCPRQTPTSHFEASVGVRFKLRDLQRYDDVLSGITQFGVNRVYGVTSESSLRTAKAKEARIAAVVAAKDKAGYLAKELGLSLGQPITVQEIVAKSYFDQSLASTNSFIVDGVHTFDPKSTSFSPNDLTVTAEIEIVFELRSLKGGI